jgi:hypothetical protein
MQNIVALSSGIAIKHARWWMLGYHVKVNKDLAFEDKALSQNGIEYTTNEIYIRYC